MRREGSQQNSQPTLPGKKSVHQPGTLFIVGVPIGHPDDITIRALQVLRHASIVVSENPAATQALLQHHGLSAKLTSYGPAHLKEKISVLIDRLRQGARIAFVSDCGSPVISDPGSLLINTAHRQHIPVCSIPGPSAVIAAIAASGWSGDSFYFHGQLPDRTGLIKRRLAAIPTQTAHSIFFCPSKALSTVLKILAQLDGSRHMALACDLTTSRELILRGTASRLSTLLRGINPPDDVTVILKGQRAGRRKGPAVIQTNPFG